MRAFESRILATLCWLAGVAVLAFGAWLVCYAPDCASTETDAMVMAWLARHRTEMADHLFRAITWLGSVWVLVPLVMAAMLTLMARRLVHESYFLGASLLGSIVIMHVSKLIVARPRPTDMGALIAMPWDQSYPSAHTAQIASAMFAGLLIASRFDRRFLRWLLPFATLSVIFVGVSRVYLHVHYPSDVLVGILVSAFWVAGLAFWMLPRASMRQGCDAQ